MNKKVTSILAYCTWIGWLIGYLAGDKQGAKFHLNQGLVLAIVGLAGSVLGTALGAIPVVGAILSIAISVVNVGCTVLSVLGIIAAAKDEEKELPLIGKITILK